MDGYDFEVFTEKGSGGMRKGVQQPPSISILKSATLRLNAAAYIALGQPRYVEFLYDERNRAVGVRASKTKKNHTYSISARSKDKMISCRDFLEARGIDYSESKRYSAKNIEGMLVAHLDNPLPSWFKKRAGQGESE